MSTPITTETCPFCQHEIKPGACVCLTCGAQSEVIEREGPMFLAGLAVIAAIVCTVLSIMSAMGVGHVLAKITQLFGVPEVVYVSVGAAGMLVMIFVVPVLGWKACMRGFDSTAKREVVWSRSGKYAGAVRTI